MKTHMVTINSVKAQFDSGQDFRSFSIIIDTSNCKYQKVLKFNIMRDYTKHDPHISSWWVDLKSIGIFCQLCNLMSILYSNSLDEMVGKELFIRTNNGKTIFSGDFKDWFVSPEDIEASSDTKCVSEFRFPSVDEAVDYLLN